MSWIIFIFWSEYGFVKYFRYCCSVTLPLKTHDSYYTFIFTMVMYDSSSCSCLYNELFTRNSFDANLLMVDLLSAQRFMACHGITAVVRGPSVGSI